MAPRGITWIVYGQLVAMAVLVAVLGATTAVRAKSTGHVDEGRLSPVPS